MLMVSCATGALLAGNHAASAGGLSPREQSTEFQGMSFAGNATAGGGLSAMFWNSAAVAFAPAGIYSETHGAYVIGNTEITAAPGTTPALLGLGTDSGDIARDALIVSSYTSIRLSDRLVFALGSNSPFGLVTEPQNNNYAGRSFARTSDIKTYNFNPTLALRVSPLIAVGVGVQIERLEGTLKSANPLLAGAPNTIVQGDDTAFGFTAGVILTPTSTTSIGLGYRSSIDHTLEGTLFVSGAPFPAARVKAGVTLPEIVTLSIRQAISPQLTVLGSVEWTNWSRLEKLDVVCAQPIPGALCPGGNGSLVNSLPLGWHDGWFFSVGAEYAFSRSITLRSGVAYEISPIQNPDERTLRVPDADRIWASVGATYKWSESISLDFAYSHVFFDDAPIDRSEGPLRFVGYADTSVDILSLSIKMKTGALAELLN
jgi:long-chain fatty acid transport protein